MDHIQIVKDLLAAIEAGNTEQAGRFLADDFTFSGPPPLTMSRDQYLQFIRTLLDAFPNWRYNATDFRQQGNQVSFSFSLSGTQTRTLQSIMPGMPAVPSTGKSFRMPEARATAALRDDKVTRWEPVGGEGFDVASFYQQLGVELPQRVGR